MGKISKYYDKNIKIPFKNYDLIVNDITKHSIAFWNILFISIQNLYHWSSLQNSSSNTGHGMFLFNNHKVFMIILIIYLYNKGRKIVN